MSASAADSAFGGWSCSDRSLQVRTFEALPVSTYADAYFGLLESLDTLLERPVDLVVATSITNTHFCQAVDQTRTLVYVA